MRLWRFNDDNEAKDAAMFPDTFMLGQIEDFWLEDFTDEFKDAVKEYDYVARYGSIIFPVDDRECNEFHPFVNAFIDRKERGLFHERNNL